MRNTMLVSREAREETKTLKTVSTKNQHQMERKYPGLNKLAYLVSLEDSRIATFEEALEPPTRTPRTGNGGLYIGCRNFLVPRKHAAGSW